MKIKIITTVEYEAWKKSSAMPKVSDLKKSIEKCLGYTCGNSLASKFNFRIDCFFVTSKKLEQYIQSSNEPDANPDVISFSEFNFEKTTWEEAFYSIGDRNIYLGCIVFGYEEISRYAQENSIGSLERVMFLMVHSILHLLGFDHIRADDANVMREVEEKIMQNLGFNKQPLEYHKMI